MSFFCLTHFSGFLMCLKENPLFPKAHESLPDLALPPLPISSPATLLTCSLPSRMGLPSSSNSLRLFSASGKQLSTMNVWLVKDEEITRRLRNSSHQYGKGEGKNPTTEVKSKKVKFISRLHTRSQKKTRWITLEKVVLLRQKVLLPAIQNWRAFCKNQLDPVAVRAWTLAWDKAPRKQMMILTPKGHGVWG